MKSDDHVIAKNDIEILKKLIELDSKGKIGEINKTDFCNNKICKQHKILNPRIEALKKLKLIIEDKEGAKKPIKFNGTKENREFCRLLFLSWDNKNKD